MKAGETVEPLTVRKAKIPKVSKRGHPLSASEARVLVALTEKGMTQQEAADKFGLSVKTVEVHTRNIKSKLGANTMAHACYLYWVRYAN